MTEAAVDATGRTARKKRLRGFLSRRKGKRTEKSVSVPAGYRTFSRKLAPGLLATSSALAIGGALGVWIRTSQVVTEGLQEEQVGAVMGYESDWGRVIAVVAGIALLSAISWLWRNLWFKLVSLVSSLAVIALAVWRLPLIDQAAAGLANQARTGDIEFISFHAGFGWGAWCLVVAAVGSFLGLSAAILRELDIRRGVDT